MLKTIKIENTLDVQEVLVNNENQEGVILGMLLSNPTNENKKFDLLLGSSPEDRVIIYSASVPANSIADMTKKIAIPAGKTLYISMEDGIEYATVSLYQTVVDIVTADHLIQNMVHQVEAMKDAVANDRYIVEQKVASVEPHYDAIEDCHAHMQSIIDAPYYANVALSASNFKGDWDDSKVYSKGETVYYQGYIFMSKIDNNESNEPDAYDDTYWIVVYDRNKDIKKVVDFNQNHNGLDYIIMQDQADSEKRWKLKVNDGNIVLEEITE